MKNFELHSVDKFEKAALTAIKNSDRNLLIHAGPGSGKSEILSEKAAYLLATGAISENRKILALSFKRNSVRDLRNRVKHSIPAEMTHRFEAYTFDAFAKIIIDRFGDLLPKPWQLPAGYVIDEELLSPQKLRDEIYAATANAACSIEEIETLELGNFCSDNLLYKPLESKINHTGNLSDDIGVLMWQYWLSKKPATVIFPMLNALAEFLIRNTPHLKKILQATYGHILLDEFQDTTFDQYRLLKSAFMNSGIPVTAAGDEKQNIMLWANAMPDGMEQFINDFNAKEINLQWNFRSAPRLAELQNVVARKLLLDTLPESIPVNTDLDGKCRALIFETETEEKRFIIDEISSLLLSGYSPRDICVCVRHDSAVCSQILSGETENNALWFRDEVPIQNLLDENIVKLLFALWDVIFSDCAPESWDKVTEFLNAPQDISRLTDFKKDIKSTFEEKNFSKDDFENLINKSISFLEENKIRAAFEEYLESQWLTKCLADLVMAAERKNFAGKNFYDAILSIKGDTAIPVLSVQRCKVKEFRTVFFVGLEDNSFREFQLDLLEEGCAFFIALSRAKEQLFFTACRFRNGNPQKFDEIRPLYRLLSESGVNVEEIRPISLQ